MEAGSREEQLKALPQAPGVYLFKDDSGTVLYVGKSANLHQRVRSYFQSPQSLTPKQARMLARASDFEVFVTDSEQEALILECSLIKRHRPRYNVRLKDDKSYPYLKIDVQNEWPRLYVTRRLEQDGARYFGPYASAASVRKTLALMKQLFPLRQCRREIKGAGGRACLEHDIHRCAAPCIGAVSAEEYRDIVKGAISFLEGRPQAVIRGLERQMRQASAHLDFERAAALRDQVAAVRMVTERQKISSSRMGDQDVVALAQNRDQAYVEVFFIRGGRLMERDHFILHGTQDEGPGTIMAGFVNQFYHQAAYVPPRILLQHLPDDLAVIKGWLQGRRGSVVSVEVPQRGEKRRLVEMVAHNAQQGLSQHMARWLDDPKATAAALEGLKEALHLPQVPHVIECYDISDIAGSAAAGSMVVFQDGAPRPARYRRFRIKTVPGSDDYAMMREVLTRRFARAGDGDEKGLWGHMPDLVLIDGGRGHLNAAMATLRELGVESIPVAAIAKGQEELFRPQVGHPIVLPRSSPALYLVQRVRDESHRFALGYHHRLRRTQALGSALDDVPGIGPRRKRALLKRFGSVAAIREADIAELASVAGMSRGLAQRVKERL